jgi:hypothetical protein
MLQLLVTANVVSSLQIVSTLVMEVTLSSETSVLTRPKQHHIPEDGILVSQLARKYGSFDSHKCVGFHSLLQGSFYLFL